MVAYRQKQEVLCRVYDSGEALLEEIRKRQIAVGKWVAGMETDRLIFKEIYVPASDAVEAVTMAGFEVCSLVPLSDDEITAGFLDMGKSDDGRVVLACIARREDVERRIAEAERCGIRVRKLWPYFLGAAKTLGVEVGEYVRENCRGAVEEIEVPAVLMGLYECVSEEGFASLNLLPGEVIRKERLREAVKSHCVTALLVVGVIGFGYGCLWGAGYRERVKQEILLGRIGPVKHIAESVESKREQLTAVSGQLSGRGILLDVFYELYRYSPAAISVSKIEVLREASGTAVRIGGQANMLAEAFEYPEAMSEGKILRDLQIVNAQQIARPGGSVIEFKAEAVLGGK